MDVVHLNQKQLGRPLVHQRGHPGTLAQRGDRAQVPETLRPGDLPPGRHRSLRGVLLGDIDQDGRGPGQCRLSNVPFHR